VLVLAEVIVPAEDGGDDRRGLTEAALQDPAGTDAAVALARRLCGPVLAADPGEELVQVVHDPELAHGDSLIADRRVTRAALLTPSSRVGPGAGFSAGDRGGARPRARRRRSPAPRRSSASRRTAPRVRALPP